MRSKRYRKERKHFAVKAITAIVMVAAVAVSSVVTVMANTVPCTVVDGDKSYSFNLLSPDTDSIVAKASEEGMPVLGERDIVLVDKGVVRISRSMNLAVQDGDSYTETYAYDGDTVQTALDNAGITLGLNDTVAPVLDEAVTAETSITVTRNVTVVVSCDSKARKTQVSGGTVADALKSLGISLGSEDKVRPSEDTELTDGMHITVFRSHKITVKDENESKDYSVYATNVRLALRETGYKLDAEDKLNLPLFTEIKDGTDIEISRIEYKDTTVTETVEYSTQYEDSDELAYGETQVKTRGVNGEKEVTYRELYVNGEVTDKVVKEEKITIAPVDEIIVRGTKQEETPAADNNDNEVQETPREPQNNETQEQPEEQPREPVAQPESTGNTFVDSDGNVVSYSNVMSGQCTAYTGDQYTSTGMTPQYGVVAVNPNVIPYGTRLYITSGGVNYGYAIAGDTGGACMQGIILCDLYYNTEGECINFGRRDMTVYILS